MGSPQRDEYLDYPKRALREVIVNCYCHGDLTLSGDIKIEFYDDRVQIFSPGSLPDGLILENIKEGMSAKRNPIIVNALDKADYIENYSTGLRRIFEDYIDFHKKPHFSISDNGDIVILYNRNYDDNQETHIVHDVQSDVQNKIKILKTVERRKMIIKMIVNNVEITIDDMCKALGVSRSTIERDLSYLRRQGEVKYVGSAKTGKWLVFK